MQCQTATLNSFRSILMDAQSQGLSLHPLDQRSWLENVAICNFISMLFSLHPNISLLPSELPSAYPPPPFICTLIFLFVSDSPRLLVSISLSVAFSVYFYWCALDVLFLFPFSLSLSLSLSPFWFFFMQDVSLNNFTKSKFGFLHLCSHLPLCASFSFFLVMFFFLFSFFLSLSLSLAVSVCSCSAETERSPRTESVGVCEQEWEKERVCLRASLSLFASVCH